MIRHGQTVWNSLGKWQGQTDIELNETGILQAERVAERFAKIPVTRIYTSDLQRAKKTAKSIAKKTGAELIDMPELREISFGKWEGKTRTEMELDDEFIHWSKNHADIHAAPYGGESIYQLFERMNRAVYSIVEKEEQDAQIVIVSHNSIRCFICSVLGIPLESKIRFQIDNTSVTVLDYNKEKNKFYLITLNDRGEL